MGMQVNDERRSFLCYKTLFAISLLLQFIWEYIKYSSLWGQRQGSPNEGYYYCGFESVGQCLIFMRNNQLSVWLWCDYDYDYVVYWCLACLVESGLVACVILSSPQITFNINTGNGHSSSEEWFSLVHLTIALICVLNNKGDSFF